MAIAQDYATLGYDTADKPNPVKHIELKTCNEYVRAQFDHLAEQRSTGRSSKVHEEPVHAPQVVPVRPAAQEGRPEGGDAAAEARRRKRARRHERQSGQGG